MLVSSSIAKNFNNCFPQQTEIKYKHFAPSVCVCMTLDELYFSENFTMGLFKINQHKFDINKEQIV